MAQTWPQIADALNINRRTLTALRKREDWPVEVSATTAAVITPPQIEILRRWRAATLQEDRAAPLRQSSTANPNDRDAPAAAPTQPAPPPPPGGSQLIGAAAGVSVRYKLEQTLLTRVRREILQGKYVERHLHEAALTALAETFVSKLADMQQALPLELDGLDAGEIEKRITDRFAESRQAIIERRDIELHAAAATDAASGPAPRGRPTASARAPRTKQKPRRIPQTAPRRKAATPTRSTAKPTGRRPRR